MTFDELPLYLAVYRVQRQVEKPGSDDWISIDAKEMYKRVLTELVDGMSCTDKGIPYSLDQTVAAWRNIRKGGEKIRLLCQVALEQGDRCFYAKRGKGECNQEVTLERIIPGDEEGIYTLENCMIACSFHNTSRGKMPIESYLRSPVTACLPSSDANGEIRESQNS